MQPDAQDASHPASGRSGAAAASEQSGPAVRAPDDALPPIDPPTGGLILKLFVVPLIIVGIVISIVLAINWLSHAGTDHTKLVQAIGRNANNAWQAAHDLAMVLAQDEALRRDPAFAAVVSQALQQRLQQPLPSGPQSPQQPDARLTPDPAMLEVQVRAYLCKALGEFEIAEVVPALVAAAGASRRGEPLQRDVRLAALEAMALNIYKVRQAGSTVPAVAEDCLLQASREADELIRSRAAYALGVLGSDAARQRLGEMLRDVYPHARFNAATGLARHGDPSCVAVLASMIDPDETAALFDRPAPSQRLQWMHDSAEVLRQQSPQPLADVAQHAARSASDVAGWFDDLLGHPWEGEDRVLEAHIHVTGIRAAAKLLESVAPRELAPVAEATQRLLQREHKLPTPIRYEADDLLRRLQGAAE
jgi:HEAT repeat protein